MKKLDHLTRTLTLTVNVCLTSVTWCACNLTSTRKLPAQLYLPITKHQLKHPQTQSCTTWQCTLQVIHSIISIFQTFLRYGIRGGNTPTVSNTSHTPPPPDVVSQILSPLKIENAQSNKMLSMPKYCLL